MKVFWNIDQVKHDDREFADLFNNSEYSQRLQYLGDKQQNCTVRLSHVTKKDEHQYYFRFTTNGTGGRWIGIPGVRLSVTDLQLVSPERVTEGDSVRLTCNSSCKLTDTPTFIWYRNSHTLTNIGDELNIRSVSRTEAGHYSCGVQGQTYISPAVYLNVTYAPDTPVISISGSAVIMSGDSVTLSCSSDSNPPAEINWFKGNKALDSGRIFNISDDSGEYKCRVRNDHGVKYSVAVILNVQCEFMMVQQLIH
nr:B-cell receptor CD22-like [Danio rerio]|eukprot:XP_021333823.1 B-cell receptor CD22-like [Danio rerio]